MLKKVFVVVLLTFSLLSSRAAADLLVADNFGNQILRYNDQTGAFLGVLVSGNSTVNGGLSGPVGMRLDADSNLLVTSQNTNSILKYSMLNGQFLGEFSGPGNSANFVQPAELRYGAGGDLFVANFGGNSVDRVSPTGVWQGAFTSGGPGIAGAASFAWGPSGDMYVGSFNTGEIFVYDGTTGVYQSTLATGVVGASGLMFDGDGDLWVASLLTHQLFEFDTAGQQLTNFSTGTDTFPSYIMINPNDVNELLVSLAGAGGVYRYSLSGNPLGAFAFGGGLLVPGQTLLVNIPEPTSAGLLGLTGLGACLFRRVRRIHGLPAWR